MLICRLNRPQAAVSIKNQQLPQSQDSLLGTRYSVVATAAIAFSTTTFRRNSAAASGNTELRNMPDPNSNPATRVSRGITLTYQWKCRAPAYSAGALRTVKFRSGFS